MKLILEEDDSKVVRLYFSRTLANVELWADDGKDRKCLLIFEPDGAVRKPESANIGDFGFDEDGKLVVE